MGEDKKSKKEEDKKHKKEKEEDKKSKKEEEKKSKKEKEEDKKSKKRRGKEKQKRKIEVTWILELIWDGRNHRNIGEASSFKRAGTEWWGELFHCIFCRRKNQGLDQEAVGEEMKMKMKKKMRRFFDLKQL